MSTCRFLIEDTWFCHAIPLIPTNKIHHPNVVLMLAQCALGLRPSMTIHPCLLQQPVI